MEGRKRENIGLHMPNQFHTLVQPSTITDAVTSGLPKPTQSKSFNKSNGSFTKALKCQTQLLVALTLEYLQDFSKSIKQNNKGANILPTKETIHVATLQKLKDILHNCNQLNDP